MQAHSQGFARIYSIRWNAGFFIFDLNTRAGLRRWNSISVDDGDDNVLIITRGI
jgi:hypothetical protein